MLKLKFLLGYMDRFVARIWWKREEVASRVNHRRSVFDRHVLGLSFFEHPLV